MNLRTLGSQQLFLKTYSSQYLMQDVVRLLRPNCGKQLDVYRFKIVNKHHLVDLDSIVLAYTLFSEEKLFDWQQPINILSRAKHSYNLNIRSSEQAPEKRGIQKKEKTNYSLSIFDDDLCDRDEQIRWSSFDFKDEG